MEVSLDAFNSILKTCKGYLKHVKKLLALHLFSIQIILLFLNKFFKSFKRHDC